VQRYGDLSKRREVLADKSIPPLERLRRHYDGLNRRLIAAKFEEGCLLGNFSAEMSSQSPLIRESLTKLYARWTDDLEVAIADGQADGSISSKHSAADLAAFLLDAYEGMLLRARVERDRRPFDRFMQIAFGQILV
jgi:TetR/AcrR family transcriptional repressor of nem operon